MVQRDYVRKKKQSRKNSSRLMSNLMIIVAIILIVLFSVILYFVSTNKTEKPIEIPKARTESPTMALPEQPQERWTYLKELETPNASSNNASNSVASERQQILDSFINGPKITTKPTQSNTNTVTQQKPATIVTATPAASLNKWSLQCGAFKDKANADTLRAKLAMSGVNGNITSGQLFRVTAGPFNSQSDADKAMNSLKNNGINNCIVSAK